MPATNVHNEKQLLSLVAQGNEAAFHSLFQQYRNPLFKFSLEITKSASDAEDVVQELFIKIWHHRERLAGLDYARPYIYAMARNQLFDFMKKVARDHQMTRQLWANMHVENPDAENLVLLRESQRLINEALAQLPPAKQQIFRLSRESGLSHEQIAAKTGLSRSRVKNILVEVLKFLKEYLARFSLYLTLLLHL